MNIKNMQSNWLNEFQEWASIPCPDGEWVYRRQSAKYSEIIPKGIRNDYKSLFHSELYDISYGLAEKIFAESPLYEETPPYPHTIDDQSGLHFQNIAYSLLGGPPSADPRLSFPEVVRALAQHYDFATLFIDVSLSPIVAALFASHCKEGNRYVVNEDGDGIVFRWPARRIK